MTVKTDDSGVGRSPVKAGAKATLIKFCPQTFRSMVGPSRW